MWLMGAMCQILRNETEAINFLLFLLPLFDKKDRKKVKIIA